MARMITANVGESDRLVRLGLGILLAILGLAGLTAYLDVEMWVSVVGLVVGAILIATGLARRCLLYRAFGIDTSQ